MRNSAGKSRDELEAVPLKKEKFDYEKMKSAATHSDRAVRKRTFVEYFERFQEFPTYLFDNERGIDPMLQQTIDDMSGDPHISKPLRAGIELLLRRLA